MPSMKTDATLRDGPNGAKSAVIASAGDDVAVLGIKDGWTQIKLVRAAGQPTGWVASDDVSTDAAQPVDPFDPKSFARLCLIQALTCGVNSHYILAVAQLRSGLKDDVAGDKMGPFRLTQPEWNQVITDPDLNGRVQSEHISDWAFQCVVFALMVQRAQEALVKELGDEAVTATNLYLAQLVGAKAAAATVKTPANGIDTILAGVEDSALPPGGQTRAQILARYPEVLASDGGAAATGQTALQKIAAALNTALQATADLEIGAEDGIMDVPADPDADPPGSTEQFGADPSNGKISAEAFALIVELEVTSQQVYEKKYRRPEWPGEKSGVTIGIGYDVGYASKAQLEDDWGRTSVPKDMIQKLEQAIGVHGAAAKSLAEALRASVDIPWNDAITVHRDCVIPRWVTLVESRVPNTNLIGPDCLGALVSLAYNRGASFTAGGPRYAEMRSIREHMAARQFSSIPKDIRDMKRLWPDTPGLQSRREREAKLFERGLGKISQGTGGTAQQSGATGNTGAIGGQSTSAQANKIIAACEAEWPTFSADCSGFVKHVGGRLGVTLTGLANEIVDQIRQPVWRRLADGKAAKDAADRGDFVIAGLRGDEQTNPDPHGHVVVVVSGPLDATHNAYPSAYWGRLGGVGAKDQTVNFAWRAGDRDRVTYAAKSLQTG
jgi:hypothetical protein